MNTKQEIYTLSQVGFFGFIFVFLEYVNVKAEPFTILGVLMGIDLLSGIGRQWSLDKNEIKSSKLWGGLSQKIFTILGFLSLALAIKGIGYDGTVVINVILSGFILGELYSIITNVYTIRTKKDIQEYDVVSLVFKGILEWIKSTVSSRLENLEKTSKK